MLWSAPGPVTLDRWVIDPTARKINQQGLDEPWKESPRVDEGVVSRPHRYGYSAVIGEAARAITAAGDFAADAFRNGPLRHGLASGTVEAHEFGRDATVGEGVFAPASPDAAEDDGYVMAFVHDPERGAADLVILAAQDFTAEPAARVHLPARIPLGFHRSWLADHDHGRDRQRQTGLAPGTTIGGGSSSPAAGGHPRSPAHTKKEKSDGNHHH